MKKIILLILIILTSRINFSKTASNKELLDSLKYINNMLYMCEDESDTMLGCGCGNAIFWKVVKQKLNIVESLIDLISDTTATLAPVCFFGGNFTVGDIAYFAVSEIIHGIPTFELLGVKFDQNGCGFCSYWYYLREDPENRKKFKNALKSWYIKNKDKLVWVVSGSYYAGDSVVKHPNGGHYIVNNE